MYIGGRWHQRCLILGYCYHIVRYISILHCDRSGDCHLPVKIRVLTEVLMQAQILWDTTPCQMVNIYQHFGGDYCSNKRDC